MSVSHTPGCVNGIRVPSQSIRPRRRRGSTTRRHARGRRARTRGRRARAGGRPGGSIETRDDARASRDGTMDDDDGRTASDRARLRGDGARDVDHDDASWTMRASARVDDRREGRMGARRMGARRMGALACCFGRGGDADAEADVSASSGSAGTVSGSSRRVGAFAPSSTSSVRGEGMGRLETSPSSESKPRRESIDVALRKISHGPTRVDDRGSTRGDGDGIGDVVPGEGSGSGTKTARDLMRELAFYSKLNAKSLSKRRAANEEDLDTLRRALAQTFTFAEVEDAVLTRIALQMFLITVEEGTILMEENEPGDALYLIEDGDFDVLKNRLGSDVCVVRRGNGQIVGELALLYSVPRTATVRASRRSTVWVCTQDVFKREVKNSVEETTLSKNIFMEQVPVLSTLPLETRKHLADAMEPVTFQPFTSIMSEGDANDGKLYIILSGRAVVSKRDPNTGDNRTVNHLFRHDFFGEMETFRGLDTREFTVSSAEKAVSCYCLNREVVLATLSSASQKLLDEKSQEKIRDRMRQLKGEKSWKDVEITLLGSARIGGKQVNITTTARVNPRSFSENTDREISKIEFIEKEILGGGTGGCVHKVISRRDGRLFALKRVRKLAVFDAPAHIFCEKEVTSEISHFSLMCQHASFQDRAHLYMLFDLMDGCDLMDLLSSAVKVKMIPSDVNGQVTNVPTQMGMDEDAARYYCAMIVLAFEYLHANQIIYRDLKPENVLVGLNGRSKLGDFGYSRKLGVGERAWTFCGTPGYVAPEICLSKGYGFAVDWWALGVLTYVIITSRQPFTISKDPSQKDDPIKVMRRIVDMTYKVQYPTYASDEACDFISQLLQRNDMNRLGNVQGGARRIKEHPWFGKFDWELLESGDYEPRAVTLSSQFMQLQRERLRALEHDQLVATEMDSTRGPHDASMTRAAEVFKDF